MDLIRGTDPWFHDAEACKREMENFGRYLQGRSDRCTDERDSDVRIESLFGGNFDEDLLFSWRNEISGLEPQSTIIETSKFKKEETWGEVSPATSIIKARGYNIPGSELRVTLKRCDVPKVISPENSFLKPEASFTSLIFIALNNSEIGKLTVSEIYRFIRDHFPYFVTAPNCWKNSVRHTLSHNNFFVRIRREENPHLQGGLWAMVPERTTELQQKVQKSLHKNVAAIKNAMIHPENLELLIRGKTRNLGKSSYDSSTEKDKSSEEKALGEAECRLEIGMECSTTVSQNNVNGQYYW